MDGYIPTSDDKRKEEEWEDTIRETLMDTSKMVLDLLARSG